MQPLAKQVKKAPLIAGSLSMMMRVPYCSCNGLGSVTRNSFLGSPSGSIRAAATTGWPASVRASLPVKQTSLAPGSLPFPQNFAMANRWSAGFRAAPPAAGLAARQAAFARQAPLVFAQPGVLGQELPGAVEPPDAAA